MREFWVASGHQLTSVDRDGRMRVTDALILAWLARPEIVPPPEACATERALHARLMAAPTAPVSMVELAAMADPDARENWGFLLAMRDALLRAGSVEAGYLDLVRSGTRLPVMFYDQLVQLILRNALHGCEDVAVLRAGELFFRAQRGHVQDGALMLADDELAAELEAERHASPLTAMLNRGVQGLDVLGEGNGWTYWSRSDAHSMVLAWGADPKARAGFAQAVAAFLHHLLGLSVLVEPVTHSGDVPLRWYVGLDQVGTAIGDALWHGRPLPEGTALVGLFRLTFLDRAPVRPDMAEASVWLLLGMGRDSTIRMKPQNLVTGLPLLADGTLRPQRAVQAGRA